jgi:hypothetical protein
MNEGEEKGSGLSEQARALLDRAVGVEWYEQPGGDTDRAAYVLCRLRREHGATPEGDEAVRRALAQASPAAVVWLTSRAISFLDESGFPEDVERWFPDRGE